MIALLVILTIAVALLVTCVGVLFHASNSHKEWLQSLNNKFYRIDQRMDAIDKWQLKDRQSIRQLAKDLHWAIEYLNLQPKYEELELETTTDDPGFSHTPPRVVEIRRVQSGWETKEKK